ncbi:MAG: DnaA/Hda family protein [Gemmatimonadota bacterium]|nr:DnaA/Hda family protein [Gemmatimonadota bacterium]MDH5196222.1 DnaA/Hda family protein [Gemmatimonadota bacterium]
MTRTLNPRFSFDTFVVGPANQLAVSAARTAAENPGVSYNPLFIYSASGLGKTHLITAIGARARELAPELRVEYLTLEEFVDAYHAAVAAGHGEAFRSRFTDVDVVLIDDVQFVAQRLETQAELLRLISHLLAQARQVVLASDRPPRDIEQLDERLISQFAGGLVVDIAAPEFESRLAILRRKADERGVDFEGAVLAAVAEYNARNVRELLGLLNRLIAFQAVNEGALTVEGARTLLGLESVLQEDVETEEGVPETVPPAVDEFADFLDSVGSALARQVDAWRKRIEESVEYWDGRGYRTKRLERLLTEETPLGAEQAVRAYEADVEHLQALAADMAELDPPRAGDPVFRDPERIDDAEAAVQEAREGAGPPPGPAPHLTFESYVETAGNRVAVTAARAVTTDTSVPYNPLVIAGPNGVGKTHLLHAVANALAVRPEAVVACQSAQAFLDQYVDALERNRLEMWRARHRHATAFLLDDIHLLSLKPGSQEELFHLFNALADSGRQLVFSASGPPDTLDGIDERLVTRLQGGLVVELPAANREVRSVVARRELNERLGTTDDAVVAYLAEQPDPSLHTLVEVIQRLAQELEASGEDLSLALARRVVDGDAAAVTRPARRSRSSGVVMSPLASVRSPEKVVWRWPHVGDRLIEDMR